MPKWYEKKAPIKPALLERRLKQYTWNELGSSFLPSELQAAYLYAQLKSVTQIKNKYIQTWDLFRFML